MYDQGFGRCRGCGAPIIWTHMQSGKTMPCDPELIAFTPSGREVFVTPDGETRRGTRTEEGAMRGYISHFATCPQRAKFKRGASA